MGKYASKTASDAASAADVRPLQLGRGQRVLTKSAVILCLAALVAFAFRAVRVRVARSRRSLRQLDQETLMDALE